jgi:predicted phosphohydrolase
MLLSSRSLCLALLPFLCLPALAHPPKKINTSRETQQILPLPKGEDSFHFIIFGDRTGGPAEGIKVLAQAVKDTNLLDPDLVMTVGDLVQGYNAQEAWEMQMKEYRGTMNDLRMPWFPVAGNHDIYWRGENRPLTEHESNYEKHFGPLWYWFEHKKSGFLVLFSDEGDPAKPETARSFGKAEHQKFSPDQLAWLRRSLQEMKDLEHVFVFMHHPRWASDIYPGNNWDEVHKLLVDNGNVSACFAGHIHRLRYDGVKDGIEYFALAATGGAIPGHYPGVGYLHHYNVVTVRPDGIKVTTLPVGAAIDPKLYTVERGADLTLAMRMTPQSASDPVTLDADGQGGGLFQWKLNNPAQRPLDVTLAAAPDQEWQITPDHSHVTLAPGESKTLAFQCVRKPTHATARVQAPAFILESDYLEEAARVTLPPRRYSATWTFSRLPEKAFAEPSKPAALLVTDDKSGVRVDSSRYELPEGPFTLEAWVNPEKSQPSAGIATKTQSSGYGLLMDQNKAVFSVHLNGRYASVRSREPLPLKQWTHLAGVFDGKTLVLYINGKEVARNAAQGKRTRNNLPFYIGADPDEKGNPTRAFTGWVDEVRLSRKARYAAAFEPVRRHQTDGETVFYFPLDQDYQGIVPDRSGSQAHGMPMGSVKLKVSPP